MGYVSRRWLHTRKPEAWVGNYSSGYIPEIRGPNRFQVEDTRTRLICKCSSSVDFVLQSDRKFESLQFF